MDKKPDFDGMRNTVSAPFSERACYRFGKITVSPEFVDAVFADPEYYEKMFENA